MKSTIEKVENGYIVKNTYGDFDEIYVSEDYTDDRLGECQAMTAALEVAAKFLGPKHDPFGKHNIEVCIAQGREFKAIPEEKRN